jgi:hypothetical protein
MYSSGYTAERILIRRALSDEYATHCTGKFKNYMWGEGELSITSAAMVVGRFG